MDTETRSLLADLRDKLSKVDELEGAVEQLESQEKNVMPQIKAMVGRHLQEIRSEIGSSSRQYRGVWSSESDARAFGLIVLGATGGGRAIEALKCDYPDIHHRVMGTDDDSAGGALVPTEFFNRLIDLAETYGVFFRKAQRWPMNRDSGVFPRITGELDVYCPEEGVAPTASDFGTGTASLVAKKWSVYTFYSLELAEDAAAEVGELVARLMVRAIAKKADQIGFLGDGTAAYFNNVGVVERIKSVGTAGLVEFAGHDVYAEVTDSDLMSMVAALPQYADADAEWYCHRKFFVQVMMRLMRGSGGVTAAEMEGRRGFMYAGYPVNIVQVMSNTEADEEVPVLFGDLRQAATYGVRRDFAIRESEHYKFGEGLMTILGDMRVAINVHDVGDDTDAGPMIAGSLETTG